MSFRQPYDAIVGSFQGDWYDACRLYREWALQQVWAKRGPLHQRKDIAPQVDGAGLWLIGHPFLVQDEACRNPMRKLARTLPVDEVQKRGRTVDVEKTLEVIKETEAFFGIPICWFATAWYEGGGDVSPPRYVIPKRFPELLRRLKEETGVSIEPWIAPRRMSVQLREWGPEADRAVQKNPDGTPQVTPPLSYEGGDRWATMCWSTDYWREFWRQKIDSFAKLGMDGLHLDELCSATSFNDQCFDEGHGHTIGGGTTYFDDHRAMLQMIRETGRRVRPDFIMHCEAFSEVYMDLLDAYETDTSGEPHLIPMFQAVYHDYAHVTGRRVFRWWDPNLPQTDGDEGLDELVTAMGQFFVWGSHIGHVRRDIVRYAPEGAKYLKQLVDARLAGKKFLAYGEMLRTPRLLKKLPEINVHWERADFPEVTLATVQHSAWKAPDGTIGLVFANVTQAEQEIAYGIDLRESGLVAPLVAIKQLFPAQDDRGEQSAGGALRRTEKLPPRGVLVLEVSPA